MKVAKYLGVFCLTFLIGAALSWAYDFSKQDKPEIKVEPEKNFSNSPLPDFKTETPPKIFNTEDFWDENPIYNKKLLETGEITNGDDIKAKSGEHWLGLFSEHDEQILKSTAIKVKSFREHGFDWKKVSVKEKENPLFLVKKSKRLSEGKVTTLLREKSFQEADVPSESSIMKKGFHRRFVLGGREYTLRVEEGLSEKREKILVLLLETENSSQMIHYIYFDDPIAYIGSLYWVGDLDHDGKLDLFMDFYGYEKGYYNSGLFLSSEKKKGNLVGKIEYFALSTC